MAKKKKLLAMLYLLIYSIVTKVIGLLAIPIEEPAIQFIILLATPLSLPNNKLDSKATVSLILWSLSCLICVGILPESHFMFHLTNAMSWLWLIIECFIENHIIQKRHKHKPQKHYKHNQH